MVNLWLPLNNYNNPVIIIIVCFVQCKTMANLCNGRYIHYVCVHSTQLTCLFEGQHWTGCGIVRSVNKRKRKLPFYPIIRRNIRLPK